MKIFYSILIVCFIVMMIPNLFAEKQVPEWVKNTAGWWSNDVISETEFVNAIEYLIKDEIILVQIQPNIETLQNVPEWVKNTAGWWSNDVISETEFVNAIEYLIKIGVINISNNNCENLLKTYFPDDLEEISRICDTYDTTKFSELLPYVDNVNLNSHGFRGDDFSKTKPSNMYRIFMLGGSTMFGSGSYSDQTTIPGFLQKIFDAHNLGQNVEVINVGISGGHSISELNLIKNRIIDFDPNLIIVYDGWNDLSADYPVTDIIKRWESMCEIGQNNNFDVIITLQPIAGFGNKELTHQEMINSLTGDDHNGYQLIQAKSTYDYIMRELSMIDCEAYDFRDIFDDVSGPIYWDQGHTSDAGNLILAEEFFNILNKKITNDFLYEERFHAIISEYNSPEIISFLISKLEIEVDNDKLKINLSDSVHHKGNYFFLKNKLGGFENILVGKDLTNIDLRSMDLKGQDLSGANLSGMDLRGIDFSETILRDSNLSFANLSEQDLSGMHLRGINAHEANLENVDFRNTVFSKFVQIGDEKIRSVNTKCFDENDTTMNIINSINCMMDVLKNESIRTDFSNSSLIGAEFGSKEIYENLADFILFANFSGANLTGQDFSDLRFYASDFSNTIINDSEASNSHFILIDFSNGKIDDITCKTEWINLDWENSWRCE